MQCVVDVAVCLGAGTCVLQLPFCLHKHAQLPAPEFVALFVLPPRWPAAHPPTRWQAFAPWPAERLDEIGGGRAAYIADGVTRKELGEARRRRALEVFGSWCPQVSGVRQRVENSVPMARYCCAHELAEAACTIQCAVMLVCCCCLPLPLLPADAELVEAGCTNQCCYARLLLVSATVCCCLLLLPAGVQPGGGCRPAGADGARPVLSPAGCLQGVWPACWRGARSSLSACRLSPTLLAPPPQRLCHAALLSRTAGSMIRLNSQPHPAPLGMLRHMLRPL